MKITYLDHSGFAVECGDTLLVFDEYNPKPAQGKSGLAGGVVTEADVRAHAHSALLLSHSHSDHYCKEVLALPFESTVLSPDFPKRLSGTRLAEGESAALPGLAVRAFGSTDMGVSYLADLPGARIFHAGDYNLWHWEDESTEEEIRERLDALRKRYYDATHHCYAWRLGPRGEAFRANDDGEPSGTAGKPILGQLLSNDITDCLVVVVRYFGGTKLGVPGLIAAYRESAAEAIAAARIVERTVDRTIRVDFPYIAMNDIMRVIKEQQPKIASQEFDNLCTMVLTIRESRAGELTEKLKKAGGSIAGEDI